MSKIKKNILRIILALIGIYLVLLMPVKDTTHAMYATGKPFIWNQDSVWTALESEFNAAKQKDKTAVDSSVNILFAKERNLYELLTSQPLTPADPFFDTILHHYFHLAALIASQPGGRDSFISLYNNVRNAVKKQSQKWDMNLPVTRNTIYRVLYGMRAATEEVLLQTGHNAFDPVVKVKDEYSSTPATTIFGIKVHSGDLLLSRGGAEVSAMISRANDYPGNFSHVALIYVDDKTNQPYLVEAHIEKGVAISSAEQYIKDQKLRFMVLRPRADLAALKQDSMLPHRAAKLAYAEALKRHIPYDFKMNFYDSSALFCSEVGSYAYRKMGVQLWQAVSSISSQGVVKWLGEFGVENFVTQMPSDLEYDPQLSVVAEWRDPQTLMKDHIDNAVMDALIEQADKGKEIEFNYWQLPFVRIIKGWCIIKNKFGGIGIIPEGMSAKQALKNQSFVAMYNQVRSATKVSADQFINEKKYNPPYWKLVEMAGSAVEK